MVDTMTRTQPVLSQRALNRATLARQHLLEAEGLVRAVENPRHRRASLLTLTESGAAALRSIQEAQRAWADALGAKVGQAKLERATETLETALQALEGRRTGS
jgi:DNA-binding MarR family transcriptional regulator